jgi:eukaryotic-like serine/threonine-protein kinase
MSERAIMDQEPKAEVTPGTEIPRSPSSGDNTFGKYRFIAALGQGGMADVYLAVSMGPAGFSKLQVIKRLRPMLADEPELRTMFLDEAKLAARLNHRNVVQTNEVGLADNQYFIAMEYLDGQPYHRLIAHSLKLARPVPLAITIRILCEVLAGLHYAHELTDYDGSKLDIVHRDVSPQNVFITYDGQVKLVDFGIAKAARRQVATQTGVVKGKVAYMAAEQAFSPSSEVDRRADLYAVGVMLWEAIAQRRMWAGMSDPEIIARMLTDVPKIRSVKPDVLPELARICDRALTRDPEDRYPTAAAFRAELEPLIEKVGDRKVTAEEIGALLCDLFKESRVELRAVIEQQLALVADEAPDTLPRPMRRPTPLPRIGLDTFPPPPDSDTLKTREMRRSDLGERPRLIEPTPAQGTFSAVLTRPQGRTRAIPLIAIAVGLTAALGSFLWLFARGPRADAPPEQPSAPPLSATAFPVVPQSALSLSSAPSAAPAEAPLRDTIDAKISVLPGEAKILLDGTPLPQNPFEGKMVKDGAVHRIQFEAPGWFSQSRIVVFNKDFKVEAVLQPRPKGGDSVPGSGLTAKPDPYGDNRRK